MNKTSLIIFLFLLGILTACMPTGTSDLDRVATPAPTPLSTDSAMPVEEPIVTSEADDLPIPTVSIPSQIFPAGLLAEEAGPLLLIQTGFYDYDFINPLTQARYPIELPLSDPQFRFGRNLSPSGRQMFFPLDDDTGMIADLRTGAVVASFDLNGLEAFDPELAVIAAKSQTTELELSDVALLEVVKQAYQDSIKLLSWYQSDRYHLSVQDSGPISTSLFLVDHQSGTRLQLEQQPGLVESFQVGPDGNLLLLSKGFIFQPGTYRDNQYYLLNIATQAIQPISLPENVQNPSVFWFSVDTLGVSHQTSLSGSSDFSLLEINTKKIVQIISGNFQDLLQFGEHLFYLQSSKHPEASTFQLITFAGDLLATQQRDQHCFFQFLLSNYIIVQCGLESFLMDEALIMTPFFDSVLHLIPAPNRNAYLMINRSEQAFLLDAELQLQHELPLEAVPLEIRWLPDSNGFLYRAYGRLYYYDPINLSGDLLIESDLFTDYTNINAIWVNLD